MQGMQVQSLVRELISHVTWGNSAEIAEPAGSSAHATQLGSLCLTMKDPTTKTRHMKWINKYFLKRKKLQSGNFNVEKVMQRISKKRS